LVRVGVTVTVVVTIGGDEVLGAVSDGCSTVIRLPWGDDAVDGADWPPDAEPPSGVDAPFDASVTWLPALAGLPALLSVTWPLWPPVVWPGGADDVPHPAIRAPIAVQATTTVLNGRRTRMMASLPARCRIRRVPRGPDGRQHRHRWCGGEWSATMGGAQDHAQTGDQR
jgi:hypothetical protein